MKIQCCRCGATIDSPGNRCFYPIDPRGTKDRRWTCDKCITLEEYMKLVNTNKEDK